MSLKTYAEFFSRPYVSIPLLWSLDFCWLPSKNSKEHYIKNTFAHFLLLYQTCYKILFVPQNHFGKNAVWILSKYCFRAKLCSIFQICYKVYFSFISVMETGRYTFVTHRSIWGSKYKCEPTPKKIINAIATKTRRR